MARHALKRPRPAVRSRCGAVDSHAVWKASHPTARVAREHPKHLCTPCQSWQLDGKSQKAERTGMRRSGRSWRSSSPPAMLTLYTARHSCRDTLSATASMSVPATETRKASVAHNRRRAARTTGERHASALQVPRPCGLGGRRASGRGPRVTWLATGESGAEERTRSEAGAANAEDGRVVRGLSAFRRPAQSSLPSRTVSGVHPCTCRRPQASERGRRANFDLRN